LSDFLPSSATAAPKPQAPKAGPSNLRLRVIYGVIGAVLLLGSVWFSPWTFGLFFALVQAIMLWEFYRMMEAGGSRPAVWIGIGAGIAIFGLSFFISQELFYEKNHAAVVVAFLKAAAGLVLLLPVAFVIREMLVWKGEKAFANVGASLLGLVYVSIPMALVNVIAHSKAPVVIADNFYYETYDYRRIFSLLFLIWASDIGAYAAGKNFGKHKLAPKISPGKTWEGWAGGFLLTLLMGWALGYLLPDMPLTHRLVAASVVAIFAPIGDLAESMLKRSVDVKDSGTIMPGHGGLLDRFDAFLLVLPVLALLQLLAG